MTEVPNKTGTLRLTFSAVSNMVISTLYYCCYRDKNWYVWHFSIQKICPTFYTHAHAHTHTPTRHNTTWKVDISYNITIPEHTYMCLFLLITFPSNYGSSYFLVWFQSLPFEILKFMKH